MASTVIMLGYGDMDASETARMEMRANTEGRTTDGSLDDLRWGACSIQGWPDYMEDRYAICVDNKDLIVGVYDGHKGSKVSSLCASRLHAELLQARAGGLPLSDSLVKTFMAIDEKVGQDESLKYEGSTALVVVITDGKMVVANAGDCRCVLSRQGRALELSTDHHGDVGDERSRVMRAGGYVHGDRVYHGSLELGVSRAIGDFGFKTNAGLRQDEQVVIAKPEVREEEIGENDEFLVVASDGIWGSRSSDEVVDFVADRLRNGVASLSGMCRDLAESCLVSDSKHSSSRDNMTVVIVRFK
ncbi:probable protein phosphatase 2C 60 [Selaginella moellendorffii]|nr:probable protein phosphatase 2C 60 [Selaginella moellendorffii]|eukprot:XP_002964457.2 probable protein phosphatase 2C 60 [Selaginella moellendorffii]